MHISNYNRRCNAVFLFFLLFLALSIARLFYIQFFRSSYLANIAKKQHNLFVELEPKRGTIYDINLRPLAVNIAVDSLYASPNEISSQQKEKIIRQIMPVLKLDYAYLKNRLYRKKAFVWLARKIAPEEAEKIKTLNLKGLYFAKENKRVYPNNYLGSHILGFAGLDNNGQEGLELYYDKYLKGEPGWALFLRDARQKKLDLWEKMVFPKDGSDLVLTIDEVIQYIAERELDKAYKTHHAKGASIVVMNPHTGEIFALANRPTFDLNERNNIADSNKRNRSICDLFEPGSVFKIVTAAAALEEQKVTEEDKFFCENGAYKAGGHILHDHHAHGWLTFREVIEQSSNIGTVKVAQLLGPEVISRYARLFGFGIKRGIDLPGEIKGVVKEARQWSRTSITAVPIGHEVGVTALQLACAISAVANGGQLMKPYIVKEIRGQYGEPIKEFFPQVSRRVVSDETSSRLKKILIGAVENGTGKLIKSEEFSIAGKTGTAQKLEPNGAYSHSKFIASFIGFAPAEDPLIAVVVTVDEPRPYYFGGVVAAPVFKKVATDVLRYFKAKELSNKIIALNETERVN